MVSAILNFFAGGTFFYGFTVFFNPIRETFGWTAALTSIAFTLQRIETGVLGPIAGFLVDRVGPRKLMLFGWGIFGLGFILMSRINSLWAFYGSILIIAVGISFGSFIIINTTVAKWFTKKRSRALTLVYVGFGASGILVPVLALLISQFEWRTTLVIVGTGLWVICLPLCLVMRHKPEQYGLIGRLGFGFLGDFKNKRYLIAIALTIQTIGVFIFSYIDIDKVWLIVPFLLTFGPGYGGSIPLRPALQADYFGTSSFGTIYGLMALISMLGGLISPVFVGWVFDVTGSYSLAWRVVTLTTIPAIPLILLAKPPRIKQEP